MRTALEVANELEEAFVSGKPARELFVLITELRTMLNLTQDNVRIDCDNRAA